jgi:uncharacterized membrane protein YkvA (DUF1232 family)
MTDKKEISLPSQGNIVRDFLMRVRLIWALMRDGRISPFLKVIPILGVLYFIMPIDFVSEIALPIVGQLDDAAVLWLTNFVFLELAPPEIVMQHVKSLMPGNAANPSDDVVDAESVEFKDVDK